MASENKEYKCDYLNCDYKTKRSTDLRRHKLAKHNNSIKCKNCNKKFANQDLVDDHVLSEHKPYSCNLCNFITHQGNQSLQRHLNIVHKNNKRKSSSSSSTQEIKRHQNDNNSVHGANNLEPIAGPSHVNNPAPILPPPPPLPPPPDQRNQVRGRFSNLIHR